MQQGALLRIAFFATGATGLIYQVVWARQLQLLLGSSTLATSAVLTAFMGGFALGARLLGSLEERVQRPLTLYGGVELGVGLLALLVPTLIEALGPIYAQAAHEHPGGLPALRFGVAVLALLAPTALMGASLPAIVAEAERSGGELRASLPALYGVNLAGAISGAALGGFVLIRALGLERTNQLAALTNLCVAALAFALARPRPRTAPAPREDAATDRLLAPLLFLSGFVVLALEVVWTRLLVFSLGSTVYGFTVVVTTTLLGLALGAALSRRVLGAASPPSWLGLLHGGVALAVALGLVVTPWLFQVILALSSGGSGGEFLAASYVAAALVVLVPATLGGVMFPALTSLLAARSERRGAAIGRAQAWNGLGAVLGAGLTGLVLVPGLGLAWTVALLAGLEVAGGLALARSRRLVTAIVGLGAAAGVLLLVGRPGRPDAVDGVLRAESGGEVPRLLAFREGPIGTCSVLEDVRGRSLRIDGFEAAALGESYRYMRLMALAPLVLHPAPRDALVICFGTGTTAGTVAADPALERLQIVEIEPTVLELAPFFEARNRGVLRDPRTVARVEDGRGFLVAAAPATLDLVTLEPLPPTHAGVVALYSREFYELARRALRPGGIACQWVPMQFLRAEDTREIVATFASVFPSSAMFLMDLTGVLVGSTDDRRPLLEPSALAARLARSPALDAELAAIGVDGAAGLGRACALDRDAIARFGAGVPLITDDRPRIEDAPLRHRRIVLLGNATPWQVESLLAVAAEGLQRSREVDPAVDPARRLALATLAAQIEADAGSPERGAAWLRALAGEQSGHDAASARLGAAQVLFQAGQREAALREVEAAALADPTHPGLVAARATLGP